MKRLLAAWLSLSTFASPAQTLFTYGNEAVSVPEFLRAYQRNKTGSSDEAALRNYLDLYIAARLKIKEAHTLRMDTLPQIRADLAALRQQVAGSYLIAPARVQQLVDEAFHRMQKDRHVQHIFISFGDGSSKAMQDADRKKEYVLTALKKGTDFSKIAQASSDDPAAQENSGDLGWISAFSLPYPLENLAYTTAIGRPSEVYTSTAGYHIIKPLVERNALGRLKVAQILLAFPPRATDEQKNRLKKQADSIFSALQKGTDFAQLAALYSNDLVSAAKSGELPEFGIGEYEPAFEEAALRLKTGEVSKPVLLSDGYHIIKLLQQIPPPRKKEDPATREKIYQQVEQSDRLDYLKSELAEKILKEHGRKLTLALTDVQTFTDSVVDHQATHAARSMNEASVLLQIENEKFSLGDWMAFVNESRAGGNKFSFHKLWQAYRQQKAFNYYLDNLEKYNEDFRQQMKEFEEGNLFFEIMQRQVWTPAQSDTLALQKFFNTHRSMYNWQQSADAIVFFAPSEESATSFRNALQASANNWHATLEAHPEINSDSSRFEWSQLPGADNALFQDGIITPTKINQDDNTVSFAYIIKTHPQPQPKSFQQARADVITDYQNEVEKTWVALLRKKFPVKINQQVWEDLVKSGRWKD